MLSQFKTDGESALLGALDFNFPEGIHAVGRLDKYSEGLLILTTNKRVTRLLFQGDVLHKRTYLVKVKNTVTEAVLQQFRTGLSIRVKGGEHYITAPCEVNIVSKPADLFEQSNPIPDYPPFTWLLITLTEGKYHQIRKMTAALHHRCQRLIRVAIENIELGSLLPGAVKEIEEAVFFDLLKIRNWQPAPTSLKK